MLTKNSGTVQHLTIADLARDLNVSRMTIHRMRQNQELPDPLPTKRRFVRWLASDIQLWIILGYPNAVTFRKVKRERARRSR